MKKWHLNILTLVSVSFLLSSCYSFNQITLPDETSKVTDMRLARIIKQRTKKDQVRIDSIVCGTYMLPEIPKTPELPYKELAKVDAGDPNELDEIQSHHIDELRQYIDKMKKDLRQHHNEYMTKCHGASGKK